VYHSAVKYSQTLMDKIVDVVLAYKPKRKNKPKRKKRTKRVIKKIAVTLLLLILPSLHGTKAVVPVPRQAVDKCTPISNAKQNQSTADKTASDNPTSVNQQNTSSSQKPGEGQQTDGHEQKPNEPVVIVPPTHKGLLDYFNALMTYQLGIVGFLTLLAIWYQAYRTSQSAKAMEKSVLLQEAAYKQWLSVCAWNLPNVDGYMNNLEDLQIAFGIYNPTNYPLTIEHIAVKVDDKIFRDTYDAVSLPPQTPLPVNVTVTTSRSQNELFVRGMLYIEVVVMIFFTDILGRPQGYSIVRSAHLGPKIVEFTPIEHTPEEQKNQK
jgi:hypothetical protein